MNFTYSKIFLIGFRATGKSSIGKLLARKLNWDFIEMDEAIIKKTDQTINELTKEGTDWLRFREEEHQLLHSLVKKENLVVATGGGLTVNDVIKPEVKMTYGDLNENLLNNTANNLVVLLTASENIIKNRIRLAELRKVGSRPILTSKIAREVLEKIKALTLAPEKQKSEMVKKIIEDSLKVFKQRKLKYKKQADLNLDTGLLSKDEIIKKILKFLHRGGKHVH